MQTHSFNSTYRWNLYSILLFISIIILNLLRWSKLPTFIDIYYHLSVVKGFSIAGGYVLRSFWEYAPFGRPHIYPPFTHILILLFYKFNIPLLLIAKIIEFLIFPVLIIIIWYVIKGLFHRRLAFFTILIASSTYSFYLSVGNLIPASLALIFGFLAFFFIERKKIIASSLLLVFCFYSHTGVSLYLYLALLVYGLLNREIFKQSYLALVSASILDLPLIIHQLISFSYIDLANIKENFPLEINLLVYVSTFFGLIIAFRKRGRYLLFVSMVIAIIPFMLIYKYRFLSGQGMIGVILSSALLYSWIYGEIYKKVLRMHKRIIYLLSYFLLVCLLFLISSASIYSYKGNIGFLTFNSTYVNFIKKESRLIRANEISLYYPRIWQETAKIIEKNFDRNDIIYSNAPYAGGIVSVFSYHPTSTGMLSEVRPYKDFDQIAVSKIIVWFKEENGKVDKTLSSLIKRYDLEKVGETEFVYIYKNPHAETPKIKPKAIIPTRLLFMILFFISCLIIQDVARNYNQR